MPVSNVPEGRVRSNQKLTTIVLQLNRPMRFPTRAISPKADRVKDRHLDVESARKDLSDTHQIDFISISR